MYDNSFERIMKVASSVKKDLELLLEKNITLI